MQRAYAFWYGTFAGNDFSKNDAATLALEGAPLEKTAETGPCFGQLHRPGAIRAER